MWHRNRQTPNAYVSLPYSKHNLKESALVLKPSTNKWKPVYSPPLYGCLLSPLISFSQLLIIHMYSNYVLI